MSSAWKQSEAGRSWIRDYNAQYQATHSDQVSALGTAYRGSHRQHRNAQSAQWRRENRDRVRKYDRRRYAEDPAYRELERERSRAYYRAHRAARRERQHEYQRAHLPEARQRYHRREARKRSLPASMTLQEWRAIKAAYGHRCAYCGRRRVKLTRDHVIPTALGGAYAANNIVPACGPCNSSKGAKLPTKPVSLVLL